MDPDRPYQPIDCSLHDLLESAATLRKPVSIAYLDESREIATVEARIVDVRARNGVEWLKLDDGREIRLDDVSTVDGVVFGRGEGPG